MQEAYTKPKFAYGCDVDGDRVIIVRARSARRGTQSELIWQGDSGQNIPPGILDRLHAELIEGMAHINAAIPAKSAIIRWVEVPFKSVRKARQILPSLLDVQLPFPLESAAYAFSGARANGGGSLAFLSVAMKRSMLEERIRFLEERKIEATGLDHEGLVAWDYLLRHHPPHANQRRAVLIVHHDYVSISMGRGSLLGGIYTCRDTRPTAVAIKMRQILMLSESESAGAAVELFLAGRDDDAGQLQAEILKEVADVTELAFTDLAAPETLLATALAERVIEGVGRPLNLRAGAFSSRKSEQVVAHRRFVSACVYAVCAAAFLGLNLGWRHAQTAAERSAQAEVTRQAKMLAPGERIQKGQEVRGVLRALESSSDTRRMIPRFFEEDAGLLHARLARVAEAQGLWLESAIIRDGFVSIRGSFEEKNRHEALAATLKDAGYDLEPVQREPPHQGERFRFTLKGKRGALER